MAGAREYVGVLALSLLCVLSSLATPNARGGGPPSEQTADISGDQTFPPANLTREAQRDGLAGWLNGILELNATLGPTITPASAGSEMSLFDGFNQTTSLPINGSDYGSPSGTVLSLYYVRTTAEFVALDLRFTPPRPRGSGDLRSLSVSMAASLGIPLGGADYVEYATHYKLPGSNGTGETVRTSKIGIWSETHDSLGIDFANHLRLYEDADARALVSLRLFRWIENPPPVHFTGEEILRAASDTVNRSYGPRTFSSAYVGLTPNFENLTWSFFVELGYPWQGGGEAYVMLLDAETLSFQRLVYRILKGPEGPAVSPYVLGGIAFVGGAIAGAAYVVMRRRRRAEEPSRRR